MPTITLPAGVYFVGDPCYCFDHDEWDELLTTTEYLQDDVAHVYKGIPLFAHSTAFGDGVYQDQSGRDYAVDAGMIGAVPEALWSNGGNALDELGLIIEFTEPVACTFDEDGSVIVIGAIRIQTAEFDEEEGW